MLSDTDSETNDLHTLTINEHYAKAFEYKKEREELAKLKDKYGSDYSESDAVADDNSEDSEDTEEDSDGGELTPAVDAAILRTLARIRKKDPAIYEGDRLVFEEEHTQTQDKAPATKSKRKEKPKPVTVRQIALASALADAVSQSRSPSLEPLPLTHTEEQALLRSETRAAFHRAMDSDPQEDDDLLIPRSRTRDEIELEEEEYKAFLEREVGEDIRNLITVEVNQTVGPSEEVEIVSHGDKQHESKKKKGRKEREAAKEANQQKDEMSGGKVVGKRKKKSKEETDQDFLMNYIFNRGWIDRSNRRVPTYNEVIASSSEQSNRRSAKSELSPEGTNSLGQSSDEDQREAQEATLSDDESFDDLADAFETSYNFRFEEPGGALIASFPRNTTSARRDSTTRKDARTRKKERQVAEKQALLEARREEIRQERALVEAAVTVGELGENGKDTSDKKKSRKQQKKEELARLKALKAKDLRRKLEMVSSEGGLGGFGDEALAQLDLDTDWDPYKHDAQMAELYGGGDNGIEDEDAEKPIWDDDINIDDIVPSPTTRSKADKKLKKKKKKMNIDDECVGVDVDEMDANLDAGTAWDDWNEEDGEWKGTEEERKRKVDAYMDEVVNRLGFSGITSHMPTRFHYTSTAAQDYGLTPAEILLATDAELNSYVGLKKIAPYRVEKGSKGKKIWDGKRIERLKDFRESLRSRVGSHYKGTWSLNASTDPKNRDSEARGEKKRKGKKERAKLKATQTEQEVNDANDLVAQQDPEVVSKRKRDSDAGPHFDSPQCDEDRDLENDTGKKRRKRRHKKRSGEGEADVTVAS